MNKKILFTLILLGCLGIVFVISILCGAVYVKPIEIAKVMNAYFTRTVDVNNSAQYVIMEIRFPRIVLVGITGAILSVVGVLMQTITQNPLAEPYVLGVSSGASAGAVSAIVLGWFHFFGLANVYVAAFVGSFLAILLVILLQSNNTSPVHLVLIGMGISSFFQAATTLIIYSSSNEAQVRSAMFWTVGSFTGVLWRDIYLPLIALGLLVAFCMVFGKELDLLLLGQGSAGQMGLSVKRFQLYVIIISSIAVSVVVSKVGVIGFVGLIIPHIMRKISGVRHRWLMLHTVLGGATFLMLADTISRTVFAPQEIPIGVVTAFVGAPVFIIMIKGMYHGTGNKRTKRSSWRKKNTQ